MKKAKSKIKIWLLGILIQILPTVIVVVILVSGVNAVVSFFTNLFSWGKDKDIDINNCTIEEMIDAVGDKDIFTDEILEEMMIDRKSLKRILNGVIDYNERIEQKTVSVEFTYTYTVEEEVEIEEDAEGTDVDETAENEEGNDSETGNTETKETVEGEETEDTEGIEDEEKKTETKMVTYSKVQAVDILVTNNSIIKEYEIDWQTIYIMCLLRSIGNYDNWAPKEIELDEDGNIINETDAIKLKDSDVDKVLSKYTPVFDYEFNVVEGPDSYTIEEARNVPHYDYAYQFQKDDGTTVYANGCIPKSQLKSVVAPAFVDMYSFSNVSTYSNEYQFLEKGEEFFVGFSTSHFMALMDNLPGGITVGDKYRNTFMLRGYTETFFPELIQ